MVVEWDTKRASGGLLLDQCVEPVREVARERLEQTRGLDQRGLQRAGELGEQLIARLSMQHHYLTQAQISDSLRSSGLQPTLYLSGFSPTDQDSCFDETDELLIVGAVKDSERPI